MEQAAVFRRIARLVVAILLAVTAAAVYHSFVFSQFQTIRIEISGSELHAERHVVTVALPDLSSLGGETAVLGVRLRNFGSDERQIGLLLEGLRNNRIAVPADGTTRWDIVLPPDIVQALADGRGDAPQSLEFTGDADGWAVIGLEIRNYHLRLGDRPAAVVLPQPSRAGTSRAGFLAVWVVLVLLALAIAFAPASQRRSLRLAATALAVTAFIVCAACLILPLISPARLLLSRPAFAIVVAVLFSPALLNPPALLVAARGAITRLLPVVSAHWTRHEVTFERAAAFLALCAIGIAQPIFEVVSNSPEFFAARSTSPATAVTAVLAICLGLPLALLAVERAIRLVSRRAAATFLAIVLALLAAAIVMPWFRRSEAVVWPWDALISVLIGTAVALAHNRIRVVRQFLTALAPAAFVVPALFFLDPGVAQTFRPSESAAAVQTLERTPPIVFVVFDELPLNSLLDADGGIDAGRYPNFAALARDAYWFRNATTVSSETVYAVPAILSGRYPTTKNAVPTLQYYPVNLFTALARHYDIFANLRFQKLCPPRACESNSAIPADTARSLLADFGLVWLHIVLPQPLTETLPPVVGDWADFGQARETPAAGARGGRAGVFEQFVWSIDGQPARLYFLHSMLPHMQFEYVPSGRQYRAPDYQARQEGGRRLFERVSPAYADTLHQRHLAQVGFVDRLIGDLVERLRDVGVYDEALVIVTADHGASYREGQARRSTQPHNLFDIIQVPLFVKLPGQRHGEVVDRIVETVDIFPTVLDVVADNVSLRLDGRSLIDSRIPARSSRTFIARNRLNVSKRAVKDSPDDRAASLNRKLRRFGSGDLSGLYAPPEARHWLGMNVSRVRLHAASDVKIAIADRGRFDAVELDRDPLPLYVRGALETSGSDPLTLAVVVNGTVAAVTQSYRERDAHVFGTLIPETSLRGGKNTVDVLVVDKVPR